MFIATAVLSILLALAFAAAGLPKVTGKPESIESTQKLGYPAGATRIIGLLEFAGSAGLLIGLWLAPLGAAAAIGLTLTMIGAVISHARVKDTLAHIAPAAILGILAIVTTVLRIATT
ncbi:DoxX family protein [Streptomyces sp. GbtcB7]|uniref:DoxX family protein n=1 Tax=Streptomyces sp. GbtcB7 TaxID=2824752 RepID=UPI001C2F2BBE|nr:DoxX family protein [Streptomyces sp. GbtcB7]